MAENRWLHEVGFYSTDDDIDLIDLAESVGGEFLYGHAERGQVDGAPLREERLESQLQAAQAERDVLREALVDLDLSDDFALDGAESMELVSCTRPAYLWRNLRAALRASTPSEDG